MFFFFSFILIFTFLKLPRGIHDLKCNTTTFNEYTHEYMKENI